MIHIKKMITDEKVLVGYLAKLGVFNSWTDEEYLKLKYKVIFKKELNLENPKTFNEKLQWLKLYNRKPEYTIMVDKYRVRKYVAEVIGEEYLIPLLGVWDNPNEINFADLPNRFVLKCNHNSGTGMCICRDKEKLNINLVKKELREGLREDYYIKNREWPYKNVPRKIIAEKFMQDDIGTGELSDYKVLCFNGEPKLVEIHKGRFSGRHTQDFYDTNWHKTSFEQPDDPLSNETMEKPPFADEMFRLSRALAKGIPHVRVDWYYAEGQLFFGELTFFDGAGFCAFKDNQDEILGGWIELPPKEMSEEMYGSNY